MMRAMLAGISMLGFGPRKVRWYDAEDLPEQYRNLPAEPNRCVLDAQRAARRHPSLTVCAGFAFRCGYADGWKHAWCVDEQGHRVDPSVRLHGVPTGYLGVPLRRHEIDHLAEASLVHSGGARSTA